MLMDRWARAAAEQAAQRRRRVFERASESTRVGDPRSVSNRPRRCSTGDLTRTTSLHAIHDRQHAAKESPGDRDDNCKPDFIGLQPVGFPPQKQRQSQLPEDRYLRIKFASEAGGVLVTAEEVTHQTTKRAGNPRRDWPLEPEWLCRRVEHDNNSDDDKGSKTKGVEDLDQLCSKTPLRADRRLKGLGQTAPSLRSP